MEINWTEVRGWLTFLFVVVGGVIAIRQYIAGHKQRKLENSFRLLDLFRESLREDDLEQWRCLFHASSEPAGASEGHFVQVDDGERREVAFSMLFSEGPPDDGAIERLAELFDLIAYEAMDDTVQLRVIYFKIGQLMDTVHVWLKTIEAYDGGAFLDKQYPYYAELYERGLIKQDEWPCRTHEHVG